jgi:hypothetical protein
VGTIVRLPPRWVDRKTLSQLRSDDDTDQILGTIALMLKLEELGFSEGDARNLALGRPHDFARSKN